MHGQDDPDSADNMLSLSQGQCQPLVEDDEHVSDNKYDHEPTKENMEDVGSIETEEYYDGNIHSEIVDLNVVECGQALGTNNEELTFPSHSSHPKWLGQAIMI